MGYSLTKNYLFTIGQPTTCTKNSRIQSKIVTERKRNLQNSPQSYNWSQPIGGQAALPLGKDNAGHLRLAEER